MSRAVAVLQGSLPPSELSEVARTLAFSYKTLMSDSEIWDMILAALPPAAGELVSPYRKTDVGHRVVNDLVMRFYPWERKVKYWLARTYLNETDEVAAFEINVDSSRLDFARINGQSYAYEIKTELDNTTRLATQLQNYARVFEYLYVLTHESHLSKVSGLIPECCGIIIFESHEKGCDFHLFKEASPNPDVSPEAQLRNLSSRDLAWILRQAGVPTPPPTRAEREKLVSQTFTEADIHEYFKRALKAKFAPRWKFLRQNFHSLLPIDVELFFQAPVDPAWVYYRDSSIV